MRVPSNEYFLLMHVLVPSGTSPGLCTITHVQPFEVQQTPDLQSELHAWLGLSREPKAPAPCADLPLASVSNCETPVMRVWLLYPENDRFLVDFLAVGNRASGGNGIDATH